MSNIAVALKGKPVPGPLPSFEHYILALAALTLVGLLTAGLAGLSTWCAISAINNVDQKWNGARKAIIQLSWNPLAVEAAELAALLPGLTGGGEEQMRKLGHISARVVPGLFLAWWLCAGAWVIWYATGAKGGLVMDFWAWVSGLPGRDNITINLLLGNGTLLLMVNQRNMHLSERARGNVQEVISHFTKQDRAPRDEAWNDGHWTKAIWDKRLDCLRKQNSIFIDRYYRTSWAFRFLWIAMLLYAVSVIPFGPSLAGLAGSLILIGMIVGFIGGSIMLFEFLRGPKTLMMNNEILDPEPISLAFWPKRRRKR
jgi:hypothetical protein